MFLNRVNLSINQLAAANLFLGYHRKTWNTSINFFLLGSFNLVNIINLNYTYILTKKFVNIICGLFAKRAKVWFIHEKFDKFEYCTQIKNMSKVFLEIIFFYKKWYKGSITNFKKIKKIKRKTFPHAVITPNVKSSHYLINECFIKNVPSFSFVDTIDNANNVFFCIPGNSRSLKSLFFLYFITCRAALHSRNFQSSSFLYQAFLKSKKLFIKYAFQDIKAFKRVLARKFIINFAKIPGDFRRALSILIRNSSTKLSFKGLRLKIATTLLKNIVRY